MSGPVKTVTTPSPYGVSNTDGIRMMNAKISSKPAPEVKTSGIKVRGGKAQTKGKMARGPMG